MGQYTMYRGDTLDIQIAVTSGVDKTGSPKPVDLTGAKIWMTAKKSVADADGSAVFEVTTPVDVVVTDALGGLAEIVVPASLTTSLGDQPVGLYYDIQVRLASGKVQTIEAGTLTVIPDVTRATS